MEGTRNEGEDEDGGARRSKTEQGGERGNERESEDSPRRLPSHRVPPHSSIPLSHLLPSPISLRKFDYL